MKKFVAFLLCIALLSSLLVVFVACNGNDEYKIHSSLLSDDGYVDYAKDVDVNVEAYPATTQDGLDSKEFGRKKGYSEYGLEDQGLFLASGYNEDQFPIEVKADDAENIKKYFDPTLPSLFMTHGVQLSEGRDNRVVYFAESTVGGDLAYIFHSGENFAKQKWNTFYFHYEKFADTADYDEDGNERGTAGMNPTDTERRIWMRGLDGKGNQFVLADGTYSGKDALEYSLAEWYAAEYIRTMNCIDAEFPEYAKSGNEIRTTAHSMGGALTVATVSLLNILVHDGQMSRDFLPDRMAQMDSYIGGGGADGFKIAWSGKEYINGTPRSNYYYSLENIVKDANIAVEFYYNQFGWVPFTGRIFTSAKEQEENYVYYKEIRRLVPTALLYPAFADVVQNSRAGGVPVNGHNAIYEWYFTSYKFEPIKYYNKNDFLIDESDYDMGTLKPDAKAIGTALSASAPTKLLRQMRGINIEMKRDWEGNEYTTVECDDDIFINM